MARALANGAVVSDSGYWVWNSTGWIALTPNPPEKPPSAVFGSERVQVAKMVKGTAMRDQRAASEELVTLVGELGSLAAAEQTLTERRQAAATVAPAQHPVQAPARPAVQVKTYRDGKEFEKDAKGMIAAGWQPDNQSAMDGHVNVGRTLGKAVLTGGLGLIFTGASRTKGQVTVTWLKAPPATGIAELASPAVADKYDRLAKLVELRATGVLSADEFEVEKAKVLRGD